MKDISIAVPFVAQAVAGAKAAGYDLSRILADCDIPPALLSQPRGRVPLDPFIALIQRLMRVMDDEALGLLERPQRLGTYSMVARAVLHATDLGSAMQLFARYYNLLDSGLISYVETHGDRTIYGLRRRSAAAVRSNYAVESAAMTGHRFFCWLCRARIPIVAVELDYPAPPWAEEYRYLFYRAPVIFNQPETRLSLRSADMALPVRQDISSLEDYIARAPRDLFTPTAHHTASHQVRSTILDHVRDGLGVPSMASVATALDLHPQTLRRRLRGEGTDYTELRTQVRRDVAIWMLGQPGMSVERISEALGFSESSAFIRAFRDWTGMTPRAYRRL